MQIKSLLMAVALTLLILPLPGIAAVDLEMLEDIAVDATPIDVITSKDGRWIYVLTSEANVHVYSTEGTLKGTAALDPGARGIACGAEDGVLYVTYSDRHTIQTVRLDPVHDFETSYSPFKGPADAPVTLALFTDFECTYCARLAPILDQVHHQYPDDVKIVFKNFPLRMHRFAMQAALAALAANEQGKFWPFHDRLFQNYNRLNDEKIEEIRKELDLDADQFRGSMKKPELKKFIREDLREGAAAGIRGTPTVYINGKKMRQRLSLEGFRKAIEEVLGQRRAKP